MKKYIVTWLAISISDFIIGFKPFDKYNDVVSVFFIPAICFAAGMYFYSQYKKIR